MTKNLPLKIFLSIGVLLVFIVYSLHSRNDGKAKVIAPVSTPSTPSTSSPTSSGSANSTPMSASGGGTSSSNSAGPGASQMMPTFKDGSYTGSVANAYYGNVQVKAVVSGGKLSDVQFLQYPNDNPNSSYINQQATPYLKQEALQSQSAQVNIISGATLTSQAFIESLTNALNQAKS